MGKLKCCKGCTTRYLDNYIRKTGKAVYTINYNLLQEKGLSYKTLPLLYKEIGLEPISREYSKRVIF